MSKERELLRRISSHSESRIPTNFIYEIQELLAQPEPFKPDWVNYRQGVEDAKREPLSDKEITKNTPKLIHIGERLAFHAGVRFSERHHIIGGGE